MLAKYFNRLQETNDVFHLQDAAREDLEEQKRVYERKLAELSVQLVSRTQFVHVKSFSDYLAMCGSPVTGLLCHILEGFKGCGMGPWLVLVSSCFRENVVATCKIGSLLCSLDNLLQKNVIVLFFGNRIWKWRSFEKRVIFDLLFTFSSHQGKVTKIPLVHISSTYIHVFCSPYWHFLPYQFWKKYEFIRYGFSLVWVLVLILIPAILEQSINNKMVSKI